MPLTRDKEKALVEKALQQQWENVCITKYSGDNALEWEDSVTLNMATRHCAWVLTKTCHGDSALQPIVRAVLRDSIEPSLRYLAGDTTRKVHLIFKDLKAYYVARCKGEKKLIEKKLRDLKLSPTQTASDYMKEKSQLRDKYLLAGGAMNDAEFCDVVMPDRSQLGVSVGQTFRRAVHRCRKAGSEDPKQGGVRSCGHAAQSACRRARWCTA